MPSQLKLASTWLLRKILEKQPFSCSAVQMRLSDLKLGLCLFFKDLQYLAMVAKYIVLAPKKR